MQLATHNSPDLQQAQARYAAAQSAVEAQRVQLNPQLRGYLDAAHGYSKLDLHARSSGALGNLDVSPRHRWSNTGLAAALFTWDLDLWGKQKAAVAQAAGEANAMRADQAMAANSLHYSVAVTYFDWQSLQARLQLAEASAQAAARFLALARLRTQAGLDDPQQLDRADAQLAEQRRNLAQLKGQSALDFAQLAALAGVSERDLGVLHARALPQADTDIPSDAGLSLLSRRPDIVANRWEIEASLRAIDVARKSYYPNVSLTGLAAFLRMNPNLGSGTQANVSLGSLGPSLSLPIFSGGRLHAQYETAQAQLDTAVASYNHTVVQAAHEVAEQVLAMQQWQAVQIQQAREMADATRQRDRAGRRRRQGLDDDRAYLSLQLQLDQARDGQLQIDDRLLATQLALIDALGGGYRAEDLPALPDNTAQAKQP